MNSIEKAEAYSGIVDMELSAGLTSAIFSANGVTYMGAGTVKIPKLSTSGFGNYSRGDGAKTGTVTSEWEVKTMAYDRGINLEVDAMDLDESGIVNMSQEMIGDFVRNHEIPEIEAVRYSSIFKNILNYSSVRYGYLTSSPDTILTLLTTDIGNIRNKIGSNHPLVLFMAGDAYTDLMNSKELSKQLPVSTKVGEIDMNVPMLNNVPIIQVPSDRLYTEYEFHSGETKFGFEKRPWAMQMDYIICSLDAVIAFIKHNPMTVISAGENQIKNAEKTMIRLYHDCWLFDKKRNSIFIGLESANIVSIPVAMDGATVAAGVGKITVTLGSALASLPTGYKVYAATTGSASAPTTPKAYDDYDVSSMTEISAATATDITVTATHYGVVVLVDTNDKVVAYSTAVATAE
jgi:hypothetical protein